jgi:WD40 domain-containing protein
MAICDKIKSVTEPRPALQHFTNRKKSIRHFASYLFLVASEALKVHEEEERGTPRRRESGAAQKLAEPEKRRAATAQELAEVEKQRVETEKRSSARLRYFLASLATLLVASAMCCVQTRQELATLEGHAKAVTSVAFSPDGKTLASGSDDNTVKLWVGDARQ